MGIAPTAVPTYLALTSPPEAEALTNRQAVRLIELYGNLDLSRGTIAPRPILDVWPAMTRTNEPMSRLVRRL
jgi:hypothetical protein